MFNFQATTKKSSEKSHICAEFESIELNMKKKSCIILTLFLSFSGFSFAQQNPITPDDLTIRTNLHDRIIHHTGYTLSYNKKYQIANWVAYDLTAEETTPVVKRNNRFIPDPLLPDGSAANKDYKGSGYDKGHLAPAADMCYSYQTMVESFYLSNMSPQEPSFNRGLWAKLEDQVRDWAVDEQAVYVITGTVLTEGLPTIGSSRITVPGYFYKVIFDYTEPEIKGIGFIMPNRGSQQLLQDYVVTIDSIEQITATDFFFMLPENLQEQIEGNVDQSKWKWRREEKKK